MSAPRTAAEVHAIGLEPADLRARCVVYLILCRINGKGYVGQTRHTVGGRYRGHKLSAGDELSHHALANAMRKYGAENFSLYVLERCVCLDELDNREVYWIARLDTVRPNGYNLQSGGGNGFVVAPEMGAKVSAAKQGMEFTEEHCANISIALTGRTLSDEHRANTSAGLLGRKRSDEERAAISLGRQLKGPSDLQRVTAAENLRKTLSDPAVVDKLLSTR